MIRNLILRLCGVQPVTGPRDIHPYSPAWDAFISAAISAGDVTVNDKYHAVVRGVEVWISNYPYAFGKPAYGLEVLPSIQTRARLHEACVQAVIASAPQSKQGAAG